MYIDTKIPKGLFPARNIKVQRYGMVVFVLCIPPADFAKRTTYPPTTIKNDSKNHDEPIFGPTGCDWGFLGLLLDGGRKLFVELDVCVNQPYSAIFFFL